MPLPESSIDWPPAEAAAANRLYDEYGAWYAGDPEQLASIYANTPGLDMGLGDLPKGQPGAARFVADLARGAVRRFWGAPVSVGQVRSHKVHIPLPADLAMTGADLLYGEPPKHKIKVEGSAAGRARDNVAAPDSTQQALDDIHEEANLHAVLLESGELGCAYGGSYIRVQWDPGVADVPLFDAIPPDCAVPEWRSGRLVAVTLWRALPSPDGRTWRHLERHEPGRVLHGLYRSSVEGKLGMRRPLAEHDATAPFALLVEPGGAGDTIVTGATGLACEYIPNMRPNRTMRGSPLGRSDYSGGVIGLFDQLDEAWTSWMRDLRLGKGRVVVPRSYIQNLGRGRGAVWDPEREVYEAVDSLAATNSGGGSLALQIVQFAIRVDEHSRTCRELRTQAQSSAGYSPQTFGDSDQVAATATEVTTREAASYRTRARKITYARGPLARLDRTALEIYAAKFGKAGIRPALPTITWPDGVAVDQEALARTLQLLQAAEAASIRTRVALFNPDWAPEDVDAEVIRIKDELAAAHGPAVPEPGSSATGQGPNGPAAGDGGPPNPADSATTTSAASSGKPGQAGAAA